MKQATISKTGYIHGLQCPKWLWYRTRRPGEIPEADAATRRRFDDGHQVGDCAKRLFPDGVEIPLDQGLTHAIRETKRAIRERETLFEATFLHRSEAGSTLARTDILVPVDGGAWDLVEVKGSTSVKEVYLQDVAFQRIVVEGAGLRVRSCRLLHLCSAYRRRGEIDPRKLFTSVALDALLAPYLDAVAGCLPGLFSILRNGRPPEVAVGRHCCDPYACPLTGKCWGPLPERTVFGLAGAGRRAWDLFGRGIVSRDDIPEQYPLTEWQRIQLASERRGAAHWDAGALRSFLDRLQYPIRHLDFETFRTPIPLFDGIGPYGQVPFQYSVHVQEAPGGPLEHRWFLADIGADSIDPRPSFLASLEGDLGERGSILVYNASFEPRILKEAVTEFPAYGVWVEEKVLPRIVDLYAPFRSFHLYHPDQGGSCSIKSVLPALTGSGYEGMEIADGDTAGAEFLRVSLGDVDPEERSRVRDALLAYCRLDTEAMSRVLDALAQMVPGGVRSAQDVAAAPPRGDRRRGT